MVQRGPCFLQCGRKAADGHHIYPLQYGGIAEGPQVNLCKDCHNGPEGVHNLAEAIWQHKATLESITPPDKRVLVKAILDQRQTFERTGNAPEARRRIVAELSVEEQQNVRLIKQHHAFSNQETMLKWLINREASNIKAGLS